MSYKTSLIKIENNINNDAISSIIITQMGIHGFAKFFKDCFEECNLNDYRGNKVAVDALFQIYKYAIAIRNNGKDLVNSKGESMNHLYAVFNYTLFLMRHGLMPIYLFDSKAPTIKNNTVADRKQQKIKARETCISILDKTSPEYLKHFKRTYSLKESQIIDCYRLLNAMGIPYQQCLAEADPQCAALSCNEDILGVIGDDTDILVFGTKLLLRDFSGKNKKAKEISMEKILNFLQTKTDQILNDNSLTHSLTVNHDVFVDFCILLGTDYTPQIRGYLPDELFVAFVLSDFNIPKTIEYLITDISNKINSTDNTYCIPVDFISKWNDAKTYYTTTQVIHPRFIKKTISQPNKSEIIKILCHENNFDIDCVNEMYDELNNMYMAFKGIEQIKDIKFRSFKSYQLKYQHIKHNTLRENPNKRFKLIVSSKKPKSDIYECSEVL